LLQRESVNDIEEISGRLQIPLDIIRNAIETLAEYDVITTPDLTVAEITDIGNSYNLLFDESIDDELSHLNSCSADVLRYIRETGSKSTPMQSLAVYLNYPEWRISDSLDILENLGYPVRDIII